MIQTLSLIYSNHRPETLELTAEIMGNHDLILLEEPIHQEFTRMLTGQLPIEEYLLDQDLEYPEFSLQQNKILQHLFQQGKMLKQVEPFIDNLLHIHDLFSNGNSPEDLPRPSLLFDVYSREKNATGRLLHYYSAVRSDDFGHIIDSIKDFARADAERFRLRDSLRAKTIAECLQGNSSIYIEAGPMHVLLEEFIRENLPDKWTMQTINIEQLLLQKIGIQGTIFSPGDELTANYLLQRNQSVEREDLLSARSLIYAKIVTKEENAEMSSLYAHAHNEHEVIESVNALSMNECKQLFFKIRDFPTATAKNYVDGFIHDKGSN
jgi:hypothetical protein